MKVIIDIPCGYHNEWESEKDFTHDVYDFIV